MGEAFAYCFTHRLRFSYSLLYIGKINPFQYTAFYSMFYNGVFTYNNFFELKQANEYAYDANGNFTNIL